MANLQIKNVPEELHEELRRRAKLRRMTVRDYVLELIERDSVRMTMQEWFEKMGSRPIDSDLTQEEIVQLIREEREERDIELERRIGRLGDLRSPPQA